MKSLWVICVFLVMSIEIRVKASSTENYKEVLSEPGSFLSKDELLSGVHWFRKTQDFTLKTPYGEINSFQGDFLVRMDGKKIIVFNHMGELKVVLRDSRVVQVPPGFEFWFSELQENRKNLMGQIAPFDLREQIETLGELWPRKVDELKSEIQKFQSRWGNPTATASQYYKGLAQRKIASIENAQNRQVRAQNEENRRRENNRKLLFDRAFNR